MDPSGYGQTPPPPPPSPDAQPTWAPPPPAPAPAAPPPWAPPAGQPDPFAQPGQPGQPGPYGQPYGQPGQPGQPGPYGQPPYGQPPYGDPTGMWAAPPAPSRRSRRPLFAILGVIIVVVILGAIGFVANMNSNTGQIMFSKGSYAMGSNTCKFDAPVTQVSTTDPIYIIADFNDTMQVGDSMTLTVTKDGVAYYTNTDTTDTSFNCYVEQGAIGPLPAGVYKMTFTHNGTVEATGTLTVK